MNSRLIANIKINFSPSDNALIIYLKFILVINFHTNNIKFNL